MNIRYPIYEGVYRILTHEQTVLYQAAKLRALPAYNADNLIFKEKIPVGGIFHVREHSYIFHSLIF